ncbi:nucleoside-diphosphate sugar epimerase/dehydratase [Ruminococcus sp.]|uniref:polysaccharide biosynthesis protein n=1 Tax=Ruminococcus sp. TaxID=41978 RepID=UPI002C1C4E04|nr:nucleoside-diphosphate sugar epimerase/dehydratase [Ruminococcus sp.]HNZ98263.1 nucleoside-diphosphate sugar epimerase/dehydratase [Ruminococcus sp.]HOH87398.1 nucleoside-diphosphate sugar epimerase/dehydratase [Ruminococcus sp.]
MKDLFRSFKCRKIVLAVADVFIVCVAALIANFILSFWGKDIDESRLIVSGAVSAICCIGGLLITGAYSRMWRYFNSKDYLTCVYGAIVGIVVAASIVYIIDNVFYPLYSFLHLTIITFGVCLFRYLFKSAFITLVKPKAVKGKRTMIIGGGQACRTILKEIHNAKLSPYSEDKQVTIFDPVCIIDDNGDKVGMDIEGVEIVGTTNEIHRFVRERRIEQILFAIPSCLDDERKRILDICADTKIPVKIVPFIGNLVFDEKNKTIIHQIRDIRVEGLLGREPITFDNADIRNFIGGKVCMVTGGGGSIGSELVRQIAKYAPERIIIVDIYENNAYEIEQELKMEYGDELKLVTLIASVRDYFRMNQIFDTYKPDVVFHAAAHKHVPLMEVSPMEAIKNNIIGTFNVATLAQYHDVGKFVMISTDKAVNPTNVMGASKRCCEMIVQYLAQQHEGRTEFVTTRFGNVLGSNGSVIPLFKKQIEQGRPVTVTHPDTIRYFMTIPEAVNLVMEAAAIAKGGEIFVLDMGKPVKIVTLAENLIRMYGKEPYKDVEIRFTGLRPGEKIKEELLMNEEGLQKTSNKLIFIGKQIEIDEATFAFRLDLLRNAALQNNEKIAVDALHKMVPTFTTPEKFNSKELKKETMETEVESA